MTFRLFFILGCCSSWQALAYAHATAQSSAVMIATVTSFIALMTQAGGAIMVKLFGNFLSMLWDNRVVDLIPIYTHAQFKWSFMMLVAVVVFSIIAMMGLRQNRSKI